MSLSLNPIAPWPLLGPLALLVMGLSLWVYVQRLRGTLGRWRWFALGLRVTAMILCLIAALRPSLVILQKAKLAGAACVPRRRLEEHDHLRLGRRTHPLGGGEEHDAAGPDARNEVRAGR